PTAPWRRPRPAASRGRNVPSRSDGSSVPPLPQKTAIRGGAECSREHSPVVPVQPPRNRRRPPPAPTEGRNPMPDKVLDDLFHETLKDIYYAERQILKALPKMARGAQSDHLRQAFEKHRDQTETHVERLRQVFDIIGKSPRGKT